MHKEKIKILLKLTGELFLDRKTHTLTADGAHNVIKQIKALEETHQFSIVIGGGNFFRGNLHGVKLGINASIGHQIGMLATMMNGLIIQDLLEQHKLPNALFCAMPSPEVGKPIAQQTLEASLEKNETLIFTGGTGNPFFTTDTNAILRALQVGAHEIWKGTHVDGIYNCDPKKNPAAYLVKKMHYAQALQDNIGIMDRTAFALAQEYKQKVRIFNIFTDSALIRAAQDTEFGSLIE